MNKNNLFSTENDEGIKIYKQINWKVTVVFQKQNKRKPQECSYFVQTDPYSNISERDIREAEAIQEALNIFRTNDCEIKRTFATHLIKF